jgi:hypothetical protein
MRYILAWFPMLALAVANGALRQLIFAQHMSELRAHQLSTLTGCAVLGIFIWFVVRLWPLSSSRQALAIGGIWVSFTVAFEFAMGVFLAHRPLRELLHDYNLAAGRVWPLLLLWIFVAPFILSRVYAIRRGPAR